MKQRYSTVLFISLFLISIFSLNVSAQISEQVCGGNSPCSSGLKCYNFPDVGYRCAEPNPCDYYMCPLGYDCTVLEERVPYNCAQGDDCTLTRFSEGSVICSQIEEGSLEAQTGEIELAGVSTKLEVVEETIEGKKITKVKLSNGRNAEIKIAPETASEKAIEKLGNIGFDVELKEVGKGEETEIVYEFSGIKRGKFLDLFNVKADVSAQVDVDRGEVLRIKKPWWSFLVVGI